MFTYLLKAIHTHFCRCKFCFVKKEELLDTFFQLAMSFSSFLYKHICRSKFYKSNTLYNYVMSLPLKRGKVLVSNHRRGGISVGMVTPIFKPTVIVCSINYIRLKKWKMRMHLFPSENGLNVKVILNCSAKILDIVDHDVNNK